MHSQITKTKILIKNSMHWFEQTTAQQFSSHDSTKSRITSLHYHRFSVHLWKKHPILSTPIRKVHANATNNEWFHSTNEGSVIITMSLISQKNLLKQERKKKALLKPYFMSLYGDFPCLYDNMLHTIHSWNEMCKSWEVLISAKWLS